MEGGEKDPVLDNVAGRTEEHQRLFAKKRGRRSSGFSFQPTPRSLVFRPTVHGRETKFSRSFQRSDLLHATYKWTLTPGIFLFPQMAAGLDPWSRAGWCYTKLESTKDLACRTEADNTKDLNTSLSGERMLQQAKERSTTCMRTLSDCRCGDGCSTLMR